MKRILLLLACTLTSVVALPQYQRPPEEIAKLVEAPTTPTAIFSRDKTWMALLDKADYPSIEELSRPELRIGGTRINPDNFGPSRGTYLVGLKVKGLKDLKEHTISNLPSPTQISNFIFSPDSRHAAFLQTYPDRIELWLVDLNSFSARKLSSRRVNASLYANPIIWLGNSSGLIFLAVADDKPMPPRSRVPSGPVIEENLGKKAPAPTYQNLLENEYDEKQFEHFCLSQPYLVAIDGSEKAIGKPGVIAYMSPSPDGNLLLSRTIERPYSYLVPYTRFPQRVVVTNIDGSAEKKLADIPLGENIPIARGSVISGPRLHSWRNDQPGTVYWVEALDDGDAKKKSDVRDRIMQWEYPFANKPVEIARLPLRFSGVTWGSEKVAWIREAWWSDRKTRTYQIDPSAPGKLKTIVDRSYEDSYSDPGEVVTTQNAFGWPVMAINSDNSVYLTGDGASPEGDRPFLDKFDLNSGKTTRLWRSEAPYYESIVTMVDLKKATFITSRESQTETPNYWLRSGGKNMTQLTQFPHPYPQIKDVKKQVLKYKRPDGVDLTADLYLPPGYKKEDGPLPTFLWAYPAEFKSRDAAGQVSGSPYTFPRISGGGPIFWVVRGYAVLNNTSIPIVGEGDDQPNDTYIDQLVASAKAAIDYAASLGYVDPKRVGVGGHSYGAFMTANLLAHSDLFKAGIARSGAYNRTLTPFGFQNEDRTYWEAPEVYFNMSPFSHADKIKTPILLVHGEADDNTGTYPIQTERFYNAIKGHGGTARYVLLPYESHGYRAKESIMHMLWEMDNMLETYVKGTEEMKARIEVR